MDLTVIARLEKRVDELLERHRVLQEENRRLLACQAAHEEERDLFRGELDRILGKLQRLEQGPS